MTTRTMALRGLALGVVLVGLTTACGDMPAPIDVPRDVRMDTGMGDAAMDVAPMDVAPEVGCAAPMMVCNGTCVNTQTDNGNCGSCRAVCPAGIGCVNGSCSCPMGRLVCNNQCIDPQMDNMNCGMCGNACPMGQVCAFGSCQPACTMPRMFCRDAMTMAVTCVDPNTDAMNCGVCGARCGAGYACEMGRCRCNAPNMQCGTACANIMTDRDNCGSCGNSCGMTGTCAAGVCMCGTGGTRCGMACVDTQTDVANCGACGNVCAMGQSCMGGRCVCMGGRTGCGAVCVDTMTDMNHCGMCGRVCPPTSTCMGGMCVCPTGQTACGAMCTNLMTDANNCGACGTSCGTGGACSAGRCTCAAGFMMCGAGCSDVRFDRMNCGRCGNVCPGTQVCLMGACSAAPPTRYMVAPTAPSFPFIDACAAPGHTTVLAGSDDGSAPSALPFPFRFWATDNPMATPVTVSSNGYILIGTGTGFASLSGLIPPGGTPNMIAAHWSDNYQRTGICVATMGTAPNRQYVVEWNDCGYCCPAGAGTNLTFEIILNEGTNIIDMAFQTMTGARAAGLGLTSTPTTTNLSGCPGGAGSCIPTAGQRIRFLPIP